MVVRVDLSTFVTIIHLPEIVRIFLDYVLDTLRCRLFDLKGYVVSKFSDV